MTEKFIEVNLSRNTTHIGKVKIPIDIYERKLKSYLRDMGYISASPNEYSATKIFHVNPDLSLERIIINPEEICTGLNRSIKELCITETSNISIREPNQPELKIKDIIRDDSMRGIFNPNAIVR